MNNKTQTITIDAINSNIDIDAIESYMIKKAYQAIDKAEKETGLFFDSIEFNEKEQRMYIKLKQL